MIYEERVYEIPNQVRKAFHERFEQHAMRIMNKYGFGIVGAWDEVIGDMQNFVYILAWPDMGARQAAWDKFNTDAEWAQIKIDFAKEHGQLVAKTSNRILSPTKYSPLT